MDRRSWWRPCSERMEIAGEAAFLEGYFVDPKQWNAGVAAARGLPNRWSRPYVWTRVPNKIWRRLKVSWDFTKGSVAEKMKVTGDAR